MLGVIEGRRLATEGPVEVRGSQVKTGATERRVLRGQVMTGLESIRIANMGEPGTYLAKQT